jgi:hypothetical protein
MRETGEVVRARVWLAAAAAQAAVEEAEMAWTGHPEAGMAEAAEGWMAEGKAKTMETGCGFGWLRWRQFEKQELGHDRGQRNERRRGGDGRDGGLVRVLRTGLSCVYGRCWAVCVLDEVVCCLGSGLLSQS